MDDRQGHPAVAAQYRYDKLSADGKPFRLIKLENTADGRLEIQLTANQLPSAPAYTAVSYAWGDPSRSHVLLIGDPVDSAALPVTASVHEMLAALRPDLRDMDPLYLWVDFVCINQDDPFEKDQQIPLMRDIYANASQVVCYLGTAPDAALAHDFVPLLSMFWAYIMAMQRLGVFLTSDQMLFNPFTERSDAVAAFQRFLANRYWTRAWIIQEILLGQKVRLLYGDRYMDWDLLGTVIEFFWTHTNGNEQLLRALADESSGTAIWAMNCVDNLRSIRRLILANGPLPLQDVLILACQSRATEPRDKVLAVLGLSRDATALSLQPNHALTTEQVYTNAVWHCLQQGSFALLNLAGRIHHTTMKSPLAESLPSWVPDLSHPPLLWPLDNPQTLYTAGGLFSPSSLKLSQDGKVLSARGFMAGRILALAPPFNGGFHSVSSPADYHAVLRLVGDVEATLTLSGTWLRGLWALVRRLVPPAYPGARADAPLITVPLVTAITNQATHTDGEGADQPYSSSGADTTHLRTASSSQDSEEPSMSDVPGPATSPTLDPLALAAEIATIKHEMDMESDPLAQTRIDAFRRTLVADESLHDTHYAVLFPALEEQVARDFKAYRDFALAGLSLAAVSANSSAVRDTVGMPNQEEEELGPGTLDLDLVHRLTEDDKLGNARFSALVGKKAWPRRFAVTDRGHMALVLEGAGVGDEVVVFLGARTPYVMKRVQGEKGDGGGEEEEMYELLGEAYVHGFMRGEGVDGGFEERWFHLV